MEMHEPLAKYTGVKLGGSPKLAQYAIEQLIEARKRRRVATGTLQRMVRCVSYPHRFNDKL